MIHKDCNGTVLVDVTSSYKLLAQVTQAKDGKGLNTIEIHVYNTKETCSKLIYWCISCDTEVSLDDVQVRCRGCNEALGIEDGTVPLETGGTWCGSCAKDRCGEEESISLQSIYDNDSIRLT